MNITLALPDGSMAARVEVALATIDIASLVVTIKVIGYDADDNERIVINVPYQLDALREVPAEELVTAAEDYFHEKQAKETL